MNDKWMESGFMLIQQVAHLAKYQTLKEMESCGLKPNQAGILVVLRSEGGLSQNKDMFCGSRMRKTSGLRGFEYLIRELSV